MNREILDTKVQQYINAHLTDDVHKIAMGKSQFKDVSSRELAEQIGAKKKSAKKLPTWFNTEQIYYPPVLSIEQTSSERTAIYKSKLCKGESLIDVTGGFGVDSFYFARAAKHVTHCEINTELSAIAAYNAGILQQPNIRFLATDGIEFLENTIETFDTIYIDPARRSDSKKVFMLKDCTPDVVSALPMLLNKGKRLIIKTAPLLDITAGLKELQHVSEIHIVSVKNECKELIWVIDKEHIGVVKISAVTLNEDYRSFIFDMGDEKNADENILEHNPEGYLYEPDVALLKSGAFNLIGKTYGLQKLDTQTQLFVSDRKNEMFPGRIFKIHGMISTRELKKQKQLTGNVIVRNYPDKPENLVKKYKIKPDDTRFLIFTQSKAEGLIVLDVEIVQHY
ncbi:THUMP-like domain-containing protein [Pedobacter frigoris]|uniref:class I SAM-dependent methyltransferase n=1 Tax=Pedobacter frigoris TaxID=2571272 RepID=UPI0029302907|nr:hypothetical protein [Pedobacter frigoris]